MNLNDDAEFCNLCNKPKGTPDPDADDDDDTMQRMSLKAILKAGPDAFDAEIQEHKRLEALKEVRGVFGVVINSETPIVVCDCIAFLRAQGMYTEGVFRIPGQQDIVDALKFRYVQENEDEDVLSAIPCEVNDVATLLKSYFRWLPEPAFPYENYDDILDTCRTPKASKEELEDAVFEAMENVQSPNRECICLLIQFLREVAQFEEINKMSPANLATCFAPSLLRAPDTVSPEQALMDMGPAIGVLVTLIRSDRPLFLPPKEQVRASTKHKPRDVLPPPGMGPSANERRRSSLQAGLTQLRKSLGGLVRSNKDKGRDVGAPPGLNQGREGPPPMPSRRDGRGAAATPTTVTPPKPAKELRKKSRMPADYDIDENI
ncbi:Rho GTPase activating protein, putative [Hondaea fermentalgiana]|uniref:Rho GTPase activating protein, putative n=1 Tax=Hondaea fermentalgiana TaxID=2315210 RepID=A0A2R5GW41_9STRA|nr:Rho GTPase activating protein, putative [Hondaea fermentalgiana]|eukprot:GBG35050.1 Rho GTPase activating protein, putative [Hondaea fermentalgiana]